MQGNKDKERSMDEVQREYKKKKKSLRGHECLCCVLLQVEATGRSLVQGRLTECECVTVFDQAQQ